MRTIKSSVLSEDTYDVDRSDSQSYLHSSTSASIYIPNNGISSNMNSRQLAEYHSRFKYFSAIRDSQPSNDASAQPDLTTTDSISAANLQALTHVVDDECFVYPLPLMLREAGELQNSYVISFSIWNTMIGTAVVCLPWAFQQAGIVLATCICFTSYIVCFYTSKLIVDMTGKDGDFCITLKKYFGNKGYYAGIIAPVILMFGAMTALFIILSQLLYPILLAVFYWCKNLDVYPELDLEPTFDHFSSAYTAIGLYFLLTLICSK